MAEIVEKRIELFSPAMMALKDSNLFTEEEIKRIVIKVKKAEHKLASPSRNLSDFKYAIRIYYNNLMQLRNRKTRRGDSDKFDHLEWIFIDRIVSTYQRGLQISRSDYQFNLDYFEFLKYFPEKYRQLTITHLNKMIQKFGNETVVFRKAANWYFQNRDLDEARKMLFLGQDRHPGDLQLYLDLIDIEISNIQAPGVENRIKKCIDEAIKNKVNHNFLEETIQIFENYDNLREVVHYTIKKMLENYSDDEEVWNFIALRELKGDYYPSEHCDKRSTLYSIQRAILRYKEGISKLPSNKRILLWKKYLNTLVHVASEHHNPQTAKMLKDALIEANAAKIKMDEVHYLAWIDCCKDDDVYFVSKLEEGTKEFSQSILLWSMYLKYYILKDNREIAEQIFEKAIKELGPKSINIWELYLDYHLLSSTDEEVENLYKRAISSQISEIASFFKTRYLVWAILQKSMEEVRKIYSEIADKPPYSREIHAEMIQGEQMEYGSKGSAHSRKKVLELWTKQFGSVDVDVYLHRVAAVQKQGDPDANEQIRKIYEEALRTLADEEKKNNFKARFESEVKL